MMVYGAGPGAGQALQDRPGLLGCRVVEEGLEVELKTEDCSPAQLLQLLHTLQPGQQVSLDTPLSRDTETGVEVKEGLDMEHSDNEMKKEGLDLKLDVEVKVEEEEEVELRVGGMTCSSCVSLLESRLSELPGVLEVRVALATERARVRLDTSGRAGPRELVAAVQSLGFTAALVAGEAGPGLPDHKEDIAKWRNSFLVCLGFGLPCMAAMLYFMLGPGPPVMLTPGLSLENTVLFLLATPVQLVGGRHFYRAAWAAASHRAATMDVLVVMATSLSYLYSVVVLLAAIIVRDSVSPMTFFDTPPMLLMFVSLGRWLEHSAKARTSDALSCLLSLAPPEAALVTLGPAGQVETEKDVAAELLRPGDLCLVRPGGRVPCDGRVVQGSSSCDEALITGESMPVAKHVGDTVIGGSINQVRLRVSSETCDEQN